MKTRVAITLFQKFFLFVAVLVVLAAVVYVNDGKLPRSASSMVAAVIVLSLIGLQYYSFTKSKPQKKLEDLDDDDGGIDWQEENAGRDEVFMWNGWAVLLADVPVHEARAAAEKLDAAQIRCRLELLNEDRAYHHYGHGGLGTRMCVLVAPEDYEKARKVAL